MVGESAEHSAEREHSGDDDRADHRDDLRPGVDPPPEPAEHVDPSGPGSDQKEEVEGLFRIGEGEAEKAPEDQRDHGGDPSDAHEFPLAGVRSDEATVEVVHDVAGAEVELGAHRTHERREQRRGDEAEQASGQKAQHRGIGEVLADLVGRDARELRSHGRCVGEYDQRGERDEDPRPRPKCIMRDVEEQCGADRVLLVSGREHALRDVTAAAGLRSGVVRRPPLHGQGHEHDRNPDRRITEVREDRRLRLDGGVREEAREPADLFAAEEYDGRPN